jgi:hypothetical protein
MEAAMYLAIWRPETYPSQLKRDWSVSTEKLRCRYLFGMGDRGWTNHEGGDYGC